MNLIEENNYLTTYLIVCALVIISFLIFNVKRALKVDRIKKFIVSTLLAIIIPFVLMYISYLIECKIDSGNVCGIRSVLTWMILGPIILIIHQFIFLRRNKV